MNSAATLTGESEKSFQQFFDRLLAMKGGAVSEWRIGRHASEDGLPVALGYPQPTFHRLPSRPWVRCSHAVYFRRAIDDDPIGIGLGGQGVDDGALALEVLRADREHVGGAVRAMCFVAGLPSQLL